MIRKVSILIYSISVFILSCNNNATWPGLNKEEFGSGGGIIVGKDYRLPKGSLSQYEQRQDLDPNDTAKVLFRKGDYGSKYFRIPALITTKKGTILAASDRRYEKTADLGKSSKMDVIVRRSEDLGNTWTEPVVVAKVATGPSDSYGDAFFINAHNGDVILGVIYDPGFQSAAKTVLYRSSDEGKTWREIHSFMPSQLDSSIQRGFAASGQGLTLRHGDNAGKKRLMFAYLGVTSAGIQVFTYISEDDGNTWRAGGKSKVDGNFDETKAFELANGRVMLNHRRAVRLGKRGWSIDSTFGGDFNYLGEDPEVQDPGNNADLSRYEYDGVPIVQNGEKYALFINANADAVGQWFTARKNHTVRLTHNDFSDGNGNQNGKYKYTKQLVRGGESLFSGYPTITVLPDGTIGTLTEETTDGSVTDGYDLVFRRFNLYWLSDGAEAVDYNSGLRFQEKRGDNILQ